MGFFNWPFTNLHELNLDWMIEKLQALLHMNVHTYVAPEDSPASYDEETNTLTIPTVQGPQGPRGVQGPQGPQGFSPVANVQTTDTGATITITDQQGTTTASLPNEAWIADMDAAVDNMTDATAAAVQALGAAQGAAQAVESAYLYYTYYEQGTISTASSSAGNPSNSDIFVRTDFLPFEAVASCSIDNNNHIRFYCYSGAANSAYLGEGTRAYGIADPTHIAAIKTAFPDVKYLRIGFGKTADPVTLETLESLHVTTRLLPDMMAAHETLKLENLTLTTDTTYNIYWGNNEGKNGRIDCIAEGAGTGGVTNAPYVQIVQYWRDPTMWLNDGNFKDFYKSALYRIQSPNQTTRYSWRFPAKQYTGRSFYRVVFHVPEGSSLYIQKLRLFYDDETSKDNMGINLVANSLSWAPNNTLAQVEHAAKLGYRYVTVVPKITSDDVLVCLHDDDSIQATARQDDGSAIPAADQNRPVSDFTYTYLLRYDFGIYRGLAWQGERIPKLEDIFRVCAKTGLHPVLSVHPALDSGWWSTIKMLAKKYGILHKLNIKAPSSTLYVPMAQLRDDIESYTMLGTSSVTASQCLTIFNNLKTTYAISKAICKIEYSEDLLTDQYIYTIRGAGYTCGVNNYGNDTAAVYGFLDMGVTEFTEDYNSSIGLNW